MPFMRIEFIVKTHLSKTTLEMSGEDHKTTLETSGEDQKTTLQTSGEDVPSEC